MPEEGGAVRRSGDDPSTELDVRMLEFVVENTFSAVAVIEPESGRFLFANQRACDLLGMSRREMLATCWQQISDPDDIDHALVRTRRLLSGDLERFAYRKRFRHRDDSWVYLSLVISRAVVDDRILFVVQVDDMTREGSVSALIRLVASGPDGDSMARALVLGVLDGMEVVGASLYRVDSMRKCFVSIGTHGVPQEKLSGYEVIPFDVPLPINEVYRTGTEYNASIRSMSDDFPLSRGWVSMHEDPDSMFMTILPVFSNGLVRAIAVLGSRAPLGSSWSVRNMLDTMCACIACWHGISDQQPPRPTGLALQEELRITDRQIGILELVSLGYGNKEIARRLGFSEGTIRSDLLRLTRVLRVRGRANLVDAARRAGLIHRTTDATPATGVPVELLP